VARQAQALPRAPRHLRPRWYGRCGGEAVAGQRRLRVRLTALVKHGIERISPGCTDLLQLSGKDEVARWASRRQLRLLGGPRV